MSRTFILVSIYITLLVVLSGILFSITIEHPSFLKVSYTTLKAILVLHFLLHLGYTIVNIIYFTKKRFKLVTILFFLMCVIHLCYTFIVYSFIWNTPIELSEFQIMILVLSVQIIPIIFSISVFFTKARNHLWILLFSIAMLLISAAALSLLLYNNDMFHYSRFQKLIGEICQYAGVTIPIFLALNHLSELKKLDQNNDGIIDDFEIQNR